MKINILCPDRVHYVRAFRDGKLDAIASLASTWETFEMETFSDGRVAFKTLPSHPLPGLYVRAIAGGGGDLVADRDIANDHEKFTKVVLPNDRIALLTTKGFFWRAKDLGGGKLDCIATAQREWEVFTIKTV